jgi:hypothetical protein
MKYQFWIGIFISLTLLGCTTTSTLRPAKTLEKGKAEIGGGVVTTLFIYAPVFYGAYGLSDTVDLEGRAETDRVSIMPRLQLTTAEKSNFLDILAFIDLALINNFNGPLGWHIAPGISLGRSVSFLDIYFSYKARMGLFAFNNVVTINGTPYNNTQGFQVLHALKLGVRINFNEARSIFITPEGGATIWPTIYGGSTTSSGVYQEYGLSFGVQF